MIADLIPLSFDHPEWLWLLATVPLMVALSWRALSSLDPAQRYLTLIARCIVVILVVLCLAGIAHVRTNKNLTVLFLLDRSNSIPKEMYAEQEQYVYETVKNMPRNDQVGVLTFDGQSYVEQLPMRGVCGSPWRPQTPTCFCPWPMVTPRWSPGRLCRNSVT